MQYFSIIDFLYGPVVLVLLIFFAGLHTKRKIEESPEYRYYSWGLYVKLIGGLALCFIYSFYYGGGDTINYYHDGICMMNLFFTNPSAVFTIMVDGLDIHNYFYFSPETGYPIYYRDAHTFFVVKVIFLFVLISGGSYIVATLLVTYASFTGIWRMYKVFVMEFPQLQKQMAIAILFIPSVFFWGSGILKDTITLAAIGHYTYGFYMTFIRREKMFSSFLTIALAAFFLVSIKPYIILALLPGSLVWLVQKYISQMPNKVMKTLAGPLFFVIAIGGGYVLLLNMNALLGQYSIDNVLEKAVTTYKDLKADYYKGNSFDIGEFEATVPSMLSKAPAAITAGLFRPFLWEVRNIVMLLSGIEGAILMFLTFRILWKMRIIGVARYFAKNHLLVFALIFSLFFAFSVGISTSNFGSLVRYRIPVLPFFVGSLFILEYFRKRDLKAREQFQPKSAETGYLNT